MEWLILLVFVVVAVAAGLWGHTAAWRAWFWIIDLPMSMDKPVDGEWLCGTRTGRIIPSREDNYMYEGTHGLSVATTFRAWVRSKRYRALRARGED